MSKLLQVVREELAELHPGLRTVQLVMAFLPFNTFGRVRVMLLRLLGCRIGQGTLIAGRPSIDRIVNRDIPGGSVGPEFPFWRLTSRMIVEVFDDQLRVDRAR